jgi:hypothetical protein
VIKFLRGAQVDRDEFLKWVPQNCAASAARVSLEPNTVIFSVGRNATGQVDYTLAQIKFTPALKGF